MSHDFLIERQFGENIKGSKLQRKFLLDLDEETCSEVIRFWIKANNFAMPNKKIIGEILKAFIFQIQALRLKLIGPGQIMIKRAHF